MGFISDNRIPVHAVFTTLACILLRHGGLCSDSMPISRSPGLLNYWAVKEIEFLDKLRNLSHIESTSAEFMSHIHRYIEDFDHATLHFSSFKGNVTQKANAIAQHPLAVYRMIWRLHNLLPLIREAEFTIGNFSDDIEEVFSHFPAHRWVGTSDMKDAMMGLLRIHFVYDFDTRMLADGVFAGTESGIILNSRHCMEIGQLAMQRSFHTQAIEWLEVAMLKSRVDNLSNITRLIEALNTAVITHDNLHAESKIRQHYFYDRKIEPIRASENYTTIRRRNRQVAVEAYRGNIDTTYSLENYWALCTDELNSVLNKSSKSNLFCWLESNSHPRWVIAPLKMELLSTDPDVLQIYDIIGPNRTENILNLASQSLVPSRVVDRDAKDPSATKLSTIRTSVQSWLNENTSMVLRETISTIEHATGLTVNRETSGDWLQVAGYTFSGHYEAHVDALRDHDVYGPTKGDRIATFMLYLGEPELGGYTAFTSAGVATKPVRGSAVFWYNLYKDGKADYLTYHGACPVVLGTKWGKLCAPQHTLGERLVFLIANYDAIMELVGNKWIRLYDQFLLRQCSLTPTERHRITPFKIKI